MVTHADQWQRALAGNRSPIVRDRDATRARLIAAVGALLARRGFTALGVNAVAREAGVDKVLIYRYFGGLSGLIAAFGREGDFWPTSDELTGGDPAAFAGLPLETRLVQFARHFMAAIRQRAVTQEIMAWELVARNELTEELETIREAMILDFLDRYFPEIRTRIDLQAVTAILGAAVSYLVTRSRHIRRYSGVDLQSRQGWKRLEDAMATIIRGIVKVAG